MKRWFVVILILFLAPSVAAFSDTEGYDWVHSINYLKNAGLIQGYPDKTYKPNQTINRVEFTKIAVASRYTPADWATYQTPCFSDMEVGAWYIPYVCLAKAEGILQGYDDGTFGVARTINQAEALKIILALYHENIPEAQGEWYERYLAKARDLALGYFSREAPAAHPITRGEMAYFIAWHLNDKDKDQIEWVLPVEEPSSIATGYWPSSPHSTPLEIITSPHPHTEIQSGYISNYREWQRADYPASFSNHTLPEPNIRSLAIQILARVNAARVAAGTSSLKLDGPLQKVSQEFATHLVINGVYSHSDKLGNDPFDRAAKAGINGFVSESMTWQMRNPLDSVNWWKNSSIHWNNIMDRRYTKAGVGLVREPDGGYIVIFMTGE